MKVRVGARTDIGRARQRNEDAYLAQEPLFAVADGMGGHRGGDVASAMALEVLSVPDEVSADSIASLVEGIKEANRRVLERGESDRDLRGMGTTLTALITEGDKAYVAHVGDSRAYLLRDGVLQQLTEDHTLVQRMVREGRLSPDEASRHPQRSILTRALGVEDEVPVDQLTLDVHPGDRLLLCTDGLTSMVPRERIQEILQREPDPDRAVQQLIEEANRAGGDDNITAVLLDFVDDAAEGAGEAAGSASASTVRRPSAAGRRGVDAAEPMTSVMAAPLQTATRPVAAGTLTTPAEPGTEPEESPEGEGSSASPAPRRIRWKRLVIWGAVGVVVLLAAFFGARAYVGHQWYVGVSQGKVAIYNGVPTNAIGYRLSHVKETTDIPAASAEKLQPYKDLAGGITARSLSDARTIVARIRQDLLSTQPGATG